jgi:hemoglobin
MFDFPHVDDPAEREKIEAAIDACVRTFYEKGNADPLLGPVFTSAIPDLEGHMAIVANFWSKSLLHTNRYDRQPFAPHIDLPISPEHFARWVALFTEAARETLPRTQAEQAIAKASHMAQCFQAGLYPFKDAEGNPSKTPAPAKTA